MTSRLMCFLTLLIGPIALPAQEIEIPAMPDTHAQMVHDVELTQQIDAMRADLALHQATEGVSVGVEPVSFNSANTCNGNCIGYCEQCGGNFQVYGRVDLVFAKPHFSDGLRAGEADYQYSLAPRFTLGVRDQQGTGVRTRYWVYEDRSSIFRNGPEIEQRGLRASALDLEFERALDWGSTNVALLGGIRYGKVDHYTVRGSSDKTSGEGWGPMIGLETTTPAFPCGVILANIRYAPIFGNGFSSDSGDPDVNLVGSGTIEAQIGYRIERRLDYATVRFSSMLETQQWMGFVRGSDSLGGRGDDNMLMLGWVLGIELLR